jgi:hypothetical protein
MSRRRPFVPNSALNGPTPMSTGPLPKPRMRPNSTAVGVANGAPSLAKIQSTLWAAHHASDRSRPRWNGHRSTLEDVGFSRNSEALQNRTASMCQSGVSTRPLWERRWALRGSRPRPASRLVLHAERRSRQHRRPAGCRGGIRSRGGLARSDRRRIAGDAGHDAAVHVLRQARTKLGKIGPKRKSIPTVPEN